jgi:ACS family tartrate transporter-like MFS transporter
MVEATAPVEHSFSKHRVFTRCALRILPIVTAAFIANFLDRTNVGFAALTMNRDLGFSPVVYGLGAGIFFFSYSLFQVPANLVLHRAGARRWISFILALWGIAAAATALTRGPLSFYVLRFLLGMAEAGFFPGIILYLTFWFPKAVLGRFTSMFMAGNVLSFVIGGPLASLILRLDGAGGMHAWQWLFVLEGIPACAIALAVWILLPDGPADAPWLSKHERHFVAASVAAEQSGKEQNLMRGLLNLRVLALGIAYGGILFAIYGFGFWLPLLVQSAGFSNSATGFVTSALYVASVPAMLVFARSSDRRDERIWHVAAAALFGACALFIAGIAQINFVLLPAVALAGVAMYSALTPFYGLASSFLVGRAMAGAFALINMFGGLIGGFAGQYVIGLVRERTGSYAPALALMSISLLVAAVIVLRLGRTMHSRRTPATVG